MRHIRELFAPTLCTTPIVIAKSYAGTNTFELGACIPRLKAWNHHIYLPCSACLHQVTILSLERQQRVSKSHSSWDLPGSTKEIKQDVSNNFWWIGCLAKGVSRHGEEYEGCCCLRRQALCSSRFGFGLCHVQGWQILIAYLSRCNGDVK